MLPEYVRIHISKIPTQFINMYNLLDFVTTDGWVFFEIRKGMYGLPQAGVLAHIPDYDSHFSSRELYQTPLS